MNFHRSVCLAQEPQGRETQCNEWRLKGTGAGYNVCCSFWLGPWFLSFRQEKESEMNRLNKNPWASIWLLRIISHNYKGSPPFKPKQHLPALFWTSKFSLFQTLLKDSFNPFIHISLYRKYLKSSLHKIKILTLTETPQATELPFVINRYLCKDFRYNFQLLF